MQKPKCSNNSSNYFRRARRTGRRKESSLPKLSKNVGDTGYNNNNDI